MTHSTSAAQVGQTPSATLCTCNYVQVRPRHLVVHHRYLPPSPGYIEYIPPAGFQKQAQGETHIEYGYFIVSYTTLPGRHWTTRLQKNRMWLPNVICFAFVLDTSDVTEDCQNFFASDQAAPSA